MLLPTPRLRLERLRKAWPPELAAYWRERKRLIPLAVVGLLYLLAPTLSPVAHLSDWFAGGGLWPALFAAAVIALVVVGIDDRRLRRRLREQAREREHPPLVLGK